MTTESFILNVVRVKSGLKFGEEDKYNQDIRKAIVSTYSPLRYPGVSFSSARLSPTCCSRLQPSDAEYKNCITKSARAAFLRQLCRICNDAMKRSHAFSNHSPKVWLGITLIECEKIRKAKSWLKDLVESK